MSAEPQIHDFAVDQDDPRAPSQEQWDRMSPAERQRVLDALPSEFPVSEASPPEGGIHFDAKVQVHDTLRHHFRERGMRVFLGCELPVYYPGERMFAPDIMAVCDVDIHPRDHWVVSQEGKGLDFALEIHWRGRLGKDLSRNVTKLAQLGVPEYFVWDLRRGVLYGFHLGAASRAYEPLPTRGGRLRSDVLGLEMALQHKRLRFFREGAPVPSVDEIVQWLQSTADELAARNTAEAERAEQEAQRAEQEAQRADEAERQLAALRAELEALKKG